MTTYRPELSIEGLQALQAENNRMLARLQNVDPLVQLVAADLARYAVTITHVDTGALHASHRVQVVARNRAEIYLDPGATNKFGQRTAVYGAIEHARGGAHAFYARTVQERAEAAYEHARRWLEANL